MAPQSQTTNRRQVVLLALTLDVVMLGFGIVIPVYPFYIQSMGDERHGTIRLTSCSQPRLPALLVHSSFLV